MSQPAPTGRAATWAECDAVVARVREFEPVILVAEGYVQSKPRQPLRLVRSEEAT